MNGPAIGMLPVLRPAQCQLQLPVLLRMLALVPVPRDELDRRIDDELARNPLIERAPGGPCVVCGRHTVRGLCAPCLRSRPATVDVDRAARPSVVDVLAHDVRAELPARLRSLVVPVLGSLDDRGLATASEGELAAQLGCTEEAVSSVLDAVRAVGPPGIAAPTASACLLDQARWLVEHRQAPPALAAIVADHLAAVATGELNAIALAIDEPVATVISAVAILRARLRPWVTWSADGGGELPAPPPDVVVSKDPSAPFDLRVEVTDARWFGVRLVVLPPHCRERTVRSWADPWQRQARTFLQQLDTRAGALQAVAGAVVEEQHEFVSGRRDAPAGALTRTAVASVCGLSVSTVSRVVQGKHVRLPSGAVIPMASLFDPSGSARHAVREALQRAPGLTDSEVSRRLADDGLCVARRTVAKYRAQLGIASSRSRSACEATFA